MHQKEVKQEEEKFVCWFSELSNKDISIAGGKGASLAEMYNSRFPIPPGFVISAQAYSYFVERTGLLREIHQLLLGLDVENTTLLTKTSEAIRAAFAKTPMQPELQSAIIEAYEILSVDRSAFEHAKPTALDILKHSREPSFVAVRSSATTEDLVDASFAGQQDSFLNVKGASNVITNVIGCFSSLFTPRAIYYRTKKGFSHEKAQLAVVIQKMVDSDKSGVMFSRDPTSADGHLVIEAVWGLGEGIVSGRIKPDNYLIDQNLENFKVLRAEIAEKKVAITRNSAGQNELIKLSEERSKRQVLSNYELRVLANHGRKLEEHYGKPQDIEFAINGNDIYIVQSRPITTQVKQGDGKQVGGAILLKGLGASPGVASGVVRVIHSLDELSKVQKGDVLVTEMTNPDMVVSMQKAAAIVTDEGGITSHAAIVSREMGIPAVVGTSTATNTLHDGQVITVDGFHGAVHEGRGEAQAVVINPIVPTKTEIKVIVDIPEYAVRAAQCGAKAVGLVRLEGIIATLGRHPLYYIRQGKPQDYVAALYKGLSTIADHFEHLWIRTSDLRSDEFSHLEGNEQKIEGNPMLGNHGVRYSLQEPQIMKAELEVVKRLSQHYPHKKFGVMIPQVISVEEVRATKQMARQLGMPTSVEIGIMVETPAAVQVINALCEEGISFISFGTNDLTQYILAIDRNNPEVQPLFNEMNPAVLSALSYVIRRCKKSGVYTSICGQAGSREEMARFLVGEGIDSISCNADAAQKVSMMVARIEQEKQGVAPPPSTSAVARHPEQHTHPPSTTSFSTGGRAPAVPRMQDAAISSQRQDIEETVLKELSDEYVPGDMASHTDIPPLNDAIAPESVFENEEK